MDYCTVVDVRDALSISSIDRHAQIEVAISAASREIDRYCGRRFWVDTEDRTGYFRGRGSRLLWLGPSPELSEVSTVTSVSVRDGSGGWVGYDGWEMSPPGGPATRLRCDGRWPSSGPDSVRVVGRFGRDAPTEIHAACVMLSSRVFKRLTEAPMGAALVTMEGEVVRPSRYMDGDVEQLIRPWRLEQVAV